MGVKFEGFESVEDYFLATAKELQNAIRNAVSASATFARKQAVNEIVANTPLDKDLVKDSFSIRRPKQNEDYSEVTASKKRIKIENYKPDISYNKTKGTVSADISVLRDKQTLTGRVFSNPVNDKIRRRTTPKRFPISNVTGPSINHHFGRVLPDLIPTIDDFLMKSFEEKLEKQFNKR